MGFTATRVWSYTFQGQWETQMVSPLMSIRGRIQPSKAVINSLETKLKLGWLKTNKRTLLAPSEQQPCRPWREADDFDVRPNARAQNTLLRPITPVTFHLDGRGRCRQSGTSRHLVVKMTDSYHNKRIDCGVASACCV